MSASHFVCDQAIFTSVRTPMGEGYRIIASSKGVRANEKQVITRLSPSHDSLCANETDDPFAYAMAWYPLPTKRLCLAYSCFAGAEHTGRGGQRVYTLNVVFDENDFARCGYNPFHIARTMVTEGYTIPQLKPPKVLPELQIPISDAVDPMSVPSSMGNMDPEWLETILQTLLSQKKKNLVVHTDGGWVEAAEAMILGLPGPMRVRVAFSAGLRFSVGRAHRLQWLRDEHGTAKKRIAGQPYIYIDPASDTPQNISESAWISFVRRHWECEDLSGLTRRTSRPFRDINPDYCESVGSMYNTMDAFTRIESIQILVTVSENLQQRLSDGVEIQITQELIRRAQNTLQDRFHGATWSGIKPCWPQIVSLWRQSNQGTSFARPLIEQLLHPQTGMDPISAAEAAVDLARDYPAAVDHNAHVSLLEQVLSGADEWIQNAVRATASEGQTIHPDQIAALQQMVQNWRSLRPNCPIVDRMSKACETLAEKAAMSSPSV